MTRILPPKPVALQFRLLNLQLTTLKQFLNPNGQGFRVEDPDPKPLDSFIIGGGTLAIQLS